MWLFASPGFFVFCFVQTEQRGDRILKKQVLCLPMAEEKETELSLMKKGSVSNVMIYASCCFDKG